MSSSSRSIVGLTVSLLILCNAIVLLASAEKEPDLYLLNHTWSSPLERYGVRAAYRGLLFNATVDFIAYRVLYNVTLRASRVLLHNATILRVVHAGEEATVTAWLKAPLNASLPYHFFTLSLEYNLLPEPTWVCGRVEDNGHVLILCAYTNLTSPPNIVYVYTWPYGEKRILVYRGGTLIYNDTIYDWTTIRDDYLADIVVYNATVPEWNMTALVTVYKAKPIHKSVEIPMTLRVIPRNVNASKIAISVDFNSSRVCVANNATVEDRGMLVLLNTSLYIYRFNAEKNATRWQEYWGLANTTLIPYIWLGEARCIEAPWDLRKWPFINATVVTVDDVHGNVSKWYAVPPLAPLPCNLCVHVVDEDNKPLQGAIVRLHGVEYTTDAMGTASFMHVEGVATIEYNGRRVNVQLICGECITAKLDVNPPRIRFLDPYNGGIYVEAYDSHWVYLIVDGEYYGPFNGTIYVPCSPGVHRVCITDMFGNSVCLSVVVPPSLIVETHVDDRILFMVSLVLAGLALIVIRLLAKAL